jgi:hypothetical protein
MLCSVGMIVLRVYKREFFINIFSGQANGHSMKTDFVCVCVCVRVCVCV